MTTGRINQVAFRATARRRVGERRENAQHLNGVCPLHLVVWVAWRLLITVHFNKQCSTSDRLVCRGST